MQVSHGVLHPSRLFYQLLIRFVLVMTLCLVAGSLWAILVASHYSSPSTSGLSGDIAQTTAYYDRV